MKNKNFSKIYTRVVLFQGHASPDPSWSRVFPLDMQQTSNGVMILLAACHPNVQNHICYALGIQK